MVFALQEEGRKQYEVFGLKVKGRECYGVFWNVPCTLPPRECFSIAVFNGIFVQCLVLRVLLCLLGGKDW